jgi:hypothetical protein
MTLVRDLPRFVGLGIYTGVGDGSSASHSPFRRPICPVCPDVSLPPCPCYPFVPYFVDSLAVPRAEVTAWDPNCFIYDGNAAMPTRSTKHSLYVEPNLSQLLGGCVALTRTHLRYHLFIESSIRRNA